MSMINVIIDNGTRSEIVEYVAKQESDMKRAQANEDHYRELALENDRNNAEMKRQLKMATFLATLITEAEYKLFAECCGIYRTYPHIKGFVHHMIEDAKKYVDLIPEYHEKKRTTKPVLDLTTMEVTRPVKMQKTNDLMGNTNFVIDLIKGGTITLSNRPGGTPYKKESIAAYCGKVRKLLEGGINGITIDPNETNPFRVLHNVLKTHKDAISEENAQCNNKLICGIKFILGQQKQFPQFEL